MFETVVLVLIILAVAFGIYRVVTHKGAGDEAATLKKSAVDFAEKEATAIKTTGERVAADIMKPIRKL
jgi:hypothetical protein